MLGDVTTGGETLLPLVDHHGQRRTRFSVNRSHGFEHVWNQRVARSSRSLGGEKGSESRGHVFGPTEGDRVVPTTL